MPGDRVFTGNKNPGVVLQILEPGAREAADYSCESSGGILIQEGWDGTPSPSWRRLQMALLGKILSFVGRGTKRELGE